MIEMSGGPRAIALLLLAAIPLAGSVSAAEPTPAEVLSDARRAMGFGTGMTLPTLDATALCTGPDGGSTTRVVSAPDGRMRFEQHLSSGHVSVMGISGDGTWQYDWVGDSTAAVAGHSVEAFLRGHEFLYLAAAPETRLEGPEGAVRTAPFAGRPARVLRFRAAHGGAVDFHYEVAGGLLLGLVQADPSSPDAPPVEVEYLEWRGAGNLRLPARVAIRHGAESFSCEFIDHRVNSTPDEAFRPSGDFGANPDVAELRRLQREARDARLKYDPERLIASFHDPLTSISAGRVNRSTPGENRIRFGGYLKSVEFQEWADTEPPVFRVSGDRSMAFVIVQKRVRLRTRTTPPHSEALQFAWMESWEKRDGQWRLMAVASTDRALDEEGK